MFMLSHPTGMVLRLVQHTGRFDESMINEEQKRCLFRWIRDIRDQRVHFELQLIVSDVDCHQRFCHFSAIHQSDIVVARWIWRCTQWNGFASLAYSEADTRIMNRILADHIQNAMKFFTCRFEHLLPLRRIVEEIFDRDLCSLVASACFNRCLQTTVFVRCSEWIAIFTSN